MVLIDVLGRLASDNSTPALRPLETTFGGGKMHGRIALTHPGYRGRELEAVTWEIIDAGVLPEGR
jgi:hypothetical protein